MEAAPHPARKFIEPSSLVFDAESVYRPTEQEIELSKAISLKRIADAMTAEKVQQAPKRPKILYLTLTDMVAERINRRQGDEVRAVNMRSQMGHRGDVVVIAPLPPQDVEVKSAVEQYRDYFRQAETKVAPGGVLIIGEIV